MKKQTLNPFFLKIMIFWFPVMEEFFLPMVNLHLHLGCPLGPEVSGVLCQHDSCPENLGWRFFSKMEWLTTWTTWNLMAMQWIGWWFQIFWTWEMGLFDLFDHFHPFKLVVWGSREIDFISSIDRTEMQTKHLWEKRCSEILPDDIGLQ